MLPILRWRKALLTLSLAALNLTLGYAAAPSNDNFANAATLTGASATAQADNSEATQEAGENHYHTIWWKWTAPAAGRVSLTSINSVANRLRMRITLLENNAVGGYIAEVGGDAPSSSFPVSQGTTIAIRIGSTDAKGSYGLTLGRVNLSLSLNTTDPVGSLTGARPSTLAHDQFAQRQTLSGLQDYAVGYNRSATNEAGEPSRSGYGTYWWTYRPTANGRLRISTTNSDDFGKVIAVYMGNSLSSLRAVARGVDSLPTLEIPVTANTDYQISLGSSNATDSYNGSGSFVLGVSLDTTSDIASLNLPNAVTLANDSFAQRVTLEGDTISAISYNASATSEVGDPAASGYGTFWWVYRPSANGRLTITTSGSDTYSHRIAVYLGASLSSLRLLTYSSGDVVTTTLPVTAGVDYIISSGATSSIGSYNTVGSLVLSATLNKSADVSLLNIPQPATLANDSFAQRVTLAGDTVSAISYNASATSEVGDPEASGYGTFWWVYRPSANGRLTITNNGSDTYSHRIAAYLGSDLNSLRLVNYASGGTITLTIPVTAGNDYIISTGATSSIGSYNTVGNLVLSLSLNKSADISSLNIPLQASVSNDNFASRLTLPGNSVTAIGYNASATREPLEPAATGYRTLWWSWQAASSGETTLDFTGSDFALNFLLPKFWTGSAVNSLTEVAAIPNKVAFNAVAGETYHFSVGMRNANQGGSIVMTVYGAPSKPIFGTAGSARWFDLGSPIQITAQADVDNGQYQWFKNGKAVAGATGATLNMPPATLADAGLYRVTAKNSLGTSQVDFHVGVIDPSGRNVTIGQGGTLVLNALAAGPGAAFKWSRNGTELADGRQGTQSFSGTSSAKLSITQFDTALDGTFTCAVSIPVPGSASNRESETTGTVTVTTVPKPVIVDGLVPPAAIARTLSWQFEASAQPNKYIVTGLPKGLVLNAATGLVSGTPSAAGSFKVKVSAQNGAGTGPVREFTLLVDGLEEGLAGTYTALVDRNGTANQDLGGTLSITIAKTGALTGSVKLGPTATAFKGQVVIPVDGGALPTFSATVARPKLAAVEFALTFNPESGALGGSVSVSGSAASVEGWANRWAKDNKPTSASGSYNVVLQVPGSELTNDDVPQGNGYFQVTVNGTTGVAAVKGVTPDGVAFTHSPVLWPTLEIPLHALIQKNKASIQGKPKIVLREAPVFADNLVNGTVSLQKIGAVSATDRLYKDGYDVDLTASGSKWVKPAPKTMLFDWADQADNAQVEFTQAGIEDVEQAESVDQTFQMLNTGAAKFDTLTTGNPCNVTLKLNAATGLFSGQITLTDPNPVANGKPVKRTVAYSGVLVPHLEEGYGWFLLPGLPTASTPIKAGKVWFGQAR